MGDSMRLLNILLITSFSLSSLAGEITLLEKGQKAPFTGILFDTQAARDQKKKLLDLDYYQDLSASQERQITLYKDLNILSEERLMNIKKDRDRLSQELVKERDKSAFNKTLWFLAGGLAATIVAFGAAKAVK
jgi:hypothetical protein